MGLMLGILNARGEVAVVGRRGKQRLWDLAERWYPETETIPWAEAKRVFDERRFRSLGVRLERGRLVAHPDAEDGPVPRTRTTFLSPFDRLVHDRDRALRALGLLLPPRDVRAEGEAGVRLLRPADPPRRPPDRPDRAAARPEERRAARARHLVGGGRASRLARCAAAPARALPERARRSQPRPAFGTGPRVDIVRGQTPSHVRSRQVRGQTPDVFASDKSRSRNRARIHGLRASIRRPRQTRDVARSAMDWGQTPDVSRSGAAGNDGVRSADRLRAWTSRRARSTPDRSPTRRPAPSSRRSTRPPRSCRRRSACTRATTTRASRTRPARRCRSRSRASRTQGTASRSARASARRRR